MEKQGRGRSIILGALALVVAVGLFLALRPGSEGNDALETSTTSPAAVNASPVPTPDRGSRWPGGRRHPASHGRQG